VEDRHRMGGLLGTNRSRESVIRSVSPYLKIAGEIRSASARELRPLGRAMAAEVIMAVRVP
jgi:hypothetical protein